MDSDNVGGPVCSDASVVVWRVEYEFAGDLSESGEFHDTESGIYGGVASSGYATLTPSGERIQRRH